MISVIIPTYNRASFLKEAIQSVLAQDYFLPQEFSGKCELIVVDDGSDDNTKEVVESFGGRVKYHCQQNRGISVARNQGLKLARGDFLAFLDSDDLWAPQKLTAQMNFMQHHPRAMACYTEEIWIRRGVRVNPKKKHRKHSGWIFDKVLPLCLISLSSALFKMEVIGKVGTFDEDLPVCEDYDFGLRVALKFPVYLLPRPLIVKRGGHPDQLSRRYWGMDRFRIKALEKALHLGLTPKQELLVRQEIVRKCKILIHGFGTRSREEESAKYRKILEMYKPA